MPKGATQHVKLNDHQYWLVARMIMQSDLKLKDRYKLRVTAAKMAGKYSGKD